MPLTNSAGAIINSEGSLNSAGESWRGGTVREH